MLGKLHFIDISIILLYFAIILWIAWWVSRGSRKDKQPLDSKDYFLAGKTAGWFVIGASLFSSNIGSEIIIGVSGAGARAEMPQANFEIIAALILILLGGFLFHSISGPACILCLNFLKFAIPKPVGITYLWSPY